MAPGWTPNKGQHVPHQFVYVLLLYMHDLLQGGLIGLHHMYWVADFKWDEDGRMTMKLGNTTY